MVGEELNLVTNAQSSVVTNAEDTASCILTLMHAATSAHILHLGTRSFAAHMALDGLYKELPGLVDDLVEAWQGKNGTLVSGWPSGYEPPMSDPLGFVKSISTYLQDERDQFGDDSELQNICDEIQALLDSTLYKLRFLS